MKIKSQNHFPLLEKYKKVFPSINKFTIFAYDGVIYSNTKLPDHLIVHENTHLKQQEKDGLEFWVENYLNDPSYRLKQEIEAYRNQIHSIKDRNLRAQVLIHCVNDLSGPLYGNIISKEEAKKCIQ